MTTRRKNILGARKTGPRLSRVVMNFSNKFLGRRFHAYFGGFQFIFSFISVSENENNIQFSRLYIRASSAQEAWKHTNPLLISDINVPRVVTEMMETMNH